MASRETIREKFEKIRGIWNYISYVKQIRAEDYLEYGFNKSQKNELIRETKDLPLTKEYLRGEAVAATIVERNLTISELAKMLGKAREKGIELNDAEKVELLRRYIAEKYGLPIGSRAEKSVNVRVSVVSDVSRAIRAVGSVDLKEFIMRYDSLSDSKTRVGEVAVIARELQELSMIAREMIRMRNDAEELYAGIVSKAIESGRISLLPRDVVREAVTNIVSRMDGKEIEDAVLRLVDKDRNVLKNYEDYLSRQLSSNIAMPSNISQPPSIVDYVLTYEMNRFEKMIMNEKKDLVAREIARIGLTEKDIARLFDDDEVFRRIYSDEKIMALVERITGISREEIEKRALEDAREFLVKYVKTGWDNIPRDVRERYIEINRQGFFVDELAGKIHEAYRSYAGLRDEDIYDAAALHYLERKIAVHAEIDDNAARAFKDVLGVSGDAKTAYNMLRRGWNAKISESDREKIDRLFMEYGRMLTNADNMERGVKATIDEIRLFNEAYRAVYGRDVASFSKIDKQDPGKIGGILIFDINKDRGYYADNLLMYKLVALATPSSGRDLVIFLDENGRFRIYGRVDDMAGIVNADATAIVDYARSRGKDIPYGAAVIRSLDRGVIVYGSAEDDKNAIISLERRGLITLDHAVDRFSYAGLMAIHKAIHEGYRIPGLAPSVERTVAEWLKRGDLSSFLMPKGQRATMTLLFGSGWQNSPALQAVARDMVEHDKPYVKIAMISMAVASGMSIGMASMAIAMQTALARSLAAIPAFGYISYLTGGYIELASAITQPLTSLPRPIDMNKLTAAWKLEKLKKIAPEIIERA